MSITASLSLLEREAPLTMTNRRGTNESVRKQGYKSQYGIFCIYADAGIEQCTANKYDDTLAGTEYSTEYNLPHDWVIKSKKRCGLRFNGFHRWRSQLRHA